MTDTPRTDAALKLNMALGWGSMVVVPKDYPPCDPWELARELERENNILKRKLKMSTEHSTIVDKIKMHWAGQGLLIGKYCVAVIAKNERKRGMYAVWSELPGAKDGPEDIKGIKSARIATEKEVRAWLLEVLNTTTTKKG